MKDLSRRNLLAAGVGGAAAAGAAAARAAAFGDPDRPPQGAVNVKNPIALQDPGPKNPVLAGQFPAFQDPPPTDVGGMALFWASFNNAHKRIQNGGWAREAIQADFAISDTISGVNMRLGPGGLRELHWRPNADEWQYYIAGQGRMTVFNTGPEVQTADFKAGDVGYVKKSFGHYVKNTGDTDLVFMEIFKADRFREVSLSQWLSVPPPDLVASHLNMDPTLIEQFPKVRADVLPA